MTFEFPKKLRYATKGETGLWISYGNQSHVARQISIQLTLSARPHQDWWLAASLRTAHNAESRRLLVRGTGEANGCLRLGFVLLQNWGNVEAWCFCYCWDLQSINIFGHAGILKVGYEGELWRRNCKEIRKKWTWFGVKCVKGIVLGMQVQALGLE